MLSHLQLYYTISYSRLAAVEDNVGDVEQAGSNYLDGMGFGLRWVEWMDGQTDGRMD